MYGHHHADSSASGDNLCILDPQFLVLVPQVGVVLVEPLIPCLRYVEALANPRMTPSHTW